MPVYSVRTGKRPEEVLKRARDYFGEEGLGLSTAEEDACCIIFEGGGGHVSVTASQEGKRSEVTLETREWDHQVRTFLRQV